MSVHRRLSALEGALGMSVGGCEACGYTSRAGAQIVTPSDATVGGCCRSCHRLLTPDGKPIAHYWVVVTGKLIQWSDDGLEWAPDGRKVRGPDHPIKVIDQRTYDAV
jgi:hypothetical protein